MKQVFLTVLMFAKTRAQVIDLLAVASLRDDLSTADFTEIYEAGKQALKAL